MSGVRLAVKFGEEGWYLFSEAFEHGTYLYSKPGCSTMRYSAMFRCDERRQVRKANFKDEDYIKNYKAIKRKKEKISMTKR